MFDPSKAYSHDGMTISRLKLCTTLISKPLQVLYKNCLDEECFPQTWKKANTVPEKATEKRQTDDQGLITAFLR